MPRAVLCIACNCIVRPEGRPFTKGVIPRRFVFVHFSPLGSLSSPLMAGRVSAFSKKTRSRMMKRPETCFDFWSAAPSILRNNCISATLLAASRVIYAISENHSFHARRPEEHIYFFLLSFYFSLVLESISAIAVSDRLDLLYLLTRNPSSTFVVSLLYFL